MRWRQQNASEEHGGEWSRRADRARGEYKVSEVVKAVRTHQNSSGQDETCLGLFLLHVGPNGDGFGG
jgi:hypothetical protein